MTVLEVLLACVQNMHFAFCLLFAICCLIMFGCFISTCVSMDDVCCDKEEGKVIRKHVLKVLKTIVPSVVVLLFLMSLPNVDDLWKVRIGLLKLELVNKTNIEAGAAVIERIGKKLECKYIGGCPEEKSK